MAPLFRIIYCPMRRFIWRGRGDRLERWTITVEPCVRLAAVVAHRGRHGMRWPAGSGVGRATAQITCLSREYLPLDHLPAIVVLDSAKAMHAKCVVVRRVPMMMTRTGSYFGSSIADGGSRSGCLSMAREALLWVEDRTATTFSASPRSQLAYAG